MSPLPGSEIARDKVPGSTTYISAEEQQRSGSPTLTDVLQARVPGVIVNDTLGNPLAADVQFRGFSASPLNGTPQGLAVYLNGVRVNEVFGDAVNWDLIPTVAIAGVTVMSNNPAFGLNALGGSISIAMKDGFTYRGLEANARLGSFGRRQASIEGGVQHGAVAAYVAVDALQETGWRDLSPTSSRRIFADIGAKGTGSEFHLSLTGARNVLGAVGPTPVELLQQRRESVFTTPQSVDNRTAMLNLNGALSLTETLKVSSVVYWRGFRQVRPDGNISDIAACANPGANAGFLCLASGGGEARIEDRNADNVLESVLGGGLAGSNDRTSVKADGIGGSLQVVSKDKLLGHGNQLAVGASIDQGQARVASVSELGLLDPNSLAVRGLGIVLGGDAFSPVGLKVRTNYYGLYFSNTLDVTDRLALTVGGRYNLAHIELKDQLGDALDGSHRFSRFNPMAGATYKLLPGVSVYAGYSEANRAPTPAELACADPARPCLLENFLVSDPPLKQVVAHTAEAGLKGELPISAGRLEWSAGLFRTLSTDDILSVASPTQGRGYFLNAGDTLRQGVEASLAYRSMALSAYVSYALVDATFRSALSLASPNNPLADASGNIQVRPGDQIPSIPMHRIKAGMDVALTREWKLGGDVVFASSQVFRGDNQPLPGYSVVNLRTSFDVSRQFQVYGLVENLFDRKFATFGTYYDTGPLSGARGLSDPRTITPAAPFGIYGGAKLRF